MRDGTSAPGPAGWQEAPSLPQLPVEEYIDMFEHRVVRFCAPVLADVKPSGMFTCPHVESHGRVELGRTPPVHVGGDVVDAAVGLLDAKLAPLGARVTALARRGAGTLVFVYRPRLLEEFAGEEPAASLLDLEGYDVSDAGACVSLLAARVASFDACPRDALTGADRFPHEVGVFLGYPLPDVLAFMRRRGRGVLMRGHWNVYTDTGLARRVFRLFDDRTEERLSRYGEGEPVEALACYDEAEVRAALRYCYRF